jgi:hypothetical protein
MWEYLDFWEEAEIFAPAYNTFWSWPRSAKGASEANVTASTPAARKMKFEKACLPLQHSKEWMSFDKQQV